MSIHNSKSATAVSFAFTLCIACSGPSEPGEKTRSKESLNYASAAKINSSKGVEVKEPVYAGPFAPSPVRMTEGQGVTGEALANLQSCEACHADVFAQQQRSAHAFASMNNPIYRVAVETLRNDVGKIPSRVCAGCHDSSLLIDGAMSAEIEAGDPRARVGVGCRLCHGIKEARRVGNADFSLQGDPLAVPKSGDAASIAVHRAAVRPPDFAAFCGSCHQSFLFSGTGNADVLAGQNELRVWQNSAYSGSGASRIDEVPAQSCVQCHMPKVPATMGDVAVSPEGTISSHAFLGGHTWLAAMRGDKNRVAQIQEGLQSAVTVDVLPGLGLLPEAGSLSLDVIIRNTGVGHRFPGGVRDAAQTWVEVQVFDAKGRLLLRSARGENRHQLRALVANDVGDIEETRKTHRFAALIADHTIAPRDVAVIRYVGKIPSGTRPDTVSVQIVHRSRSEALAKAACVESKSPRGRRYQKASLAMGEPVLSACVAQPETVVAKTVRTLSDDGGDDFKRQYERGLGLVHGRQEELGLAELSLQNALRSARRMASGGNAVPMALLALAEVQGKLGKEAASALLLDEIESLGEFGAAVKRVRGDALAKVWRWPEAALAYGDAVAIAPKNSELWARYAMALGSSGQDAKALEAATEGLKLDPVSADLLRVQALSLRGLGAPNYQEALDLYLRFRGTDRLSAIKTLCKQKSDVCAREMVPVHSHRLVP